MKFDTSGWGEFKLSDLFEISGSTTTPKQELEKYGNGEYPYITTQAIYNGIAGYYNKWTEQGQCLTIDSAVLGTCFYQSKNFSASDHVEILRPKFTINREIGLFLSIIINRMGNILGYAYTKKRSQTALKKEKISLPTDKDGKPDWEFMENTIKSTQNKMTKIIKAYELIKNGGGGGTFNLNAYKQYLSSNPNLTPLSTLQWREFKIGELFSVKSNPQLNKDSFKFTENAEYPYFTRTVFNNGILGYVKYLDEEHKIKGNSIAVGLIAMQFFYMEKDFYAGQFTKTIYPKFENFNKYIAFYFISLFNANRQKYLKDFVVKNFEKDFTNTSISLPINSSGDIDFAFMETFIKAIEKEVIKSVVLWNEKRLNATKQVISKPL